MMERQNKLQYIYAFYIYYRVNFTRGPRTVRSSHLGLDTFQLHIQLPKLVLSAHLSSGTCELHIRLSELVPSSHIGAGTCKLHTQVSKVVLLYHYGPSTPATASSPSSHLTYPPYLCTHLVLRHAHHPTTLRLCCIVSAVLHHIATLGHVVSAAPPCRVLHSPYCTTVTDELLSRKVRKDRGVGN
jgi:hypothetical protein